MFNTSQAGGILGGGLGGGLGMSGGMGGVGGGMFQQTPQSQSGGLFGLGGTGIGSGGGMFQSPVSSAPGMIMLIAYVSLTHCTSLEFSLWASGVVIILYNIECTCTCSLIV